MFPLGLPGQLQPLAVGPHLKISPVHFLRYMLHPLNCQPHKILAALQIRCILYPTALHRITTCFLPALSLQTIHPLIYARILAAIIMKTLILVLQIHHLLHHTLSLQFLVLWRRVGVMRMSFHLRHPTSILRCQVEWSLRTRTKPRGRMLAPRILVMWAVIRQFRNVASTQVGDPPLRQVEHLAWEMGSFSTGELCSSSTRRQMFCRRIRISNFQEVPHDEKRGRELSLTWANRRDDGVIAFKIWLITYLH